ncbi:MAG TPA: Tad domain-containing protein [Polyangia bacterium]|jgi:hypothetical protein
MKPLRLLRRGSSGQAMVLGAVAMLALVLGVLATLNLGQAVHEKIKLQNTADAAAYSLATLEARTFNFIAFTNRLQITHYHTAMVMQSYLSHAGFALAYFGSFLDVLRGLTYGVDAACRYILPPFLKPLYCPFVGMFYAISNALDQLAGVAQQLYDMSYIGGHAIAKEFIEAMSLYNRDAVFRRIQLLKAAQLNVHILTGMQDFIKTNDNQLGWTASGNWMNMLINMALNSFEYWSAFDRAAGMNPSAIGLFSGLISGDVLKYKMDTNDKRAQEAMSIMAEIANATRSHNDVTNRSTVFPLTFGVVNLFGSKMGQTRMIGKPSADPKPAVDSIRDQGHYWNASKPCMGDRLVSDDYLANGVGIGIWALEVSTMVNVSKVGDGIVTAGQSSKHYKYKFESGRYTGVTSRGQFQVLPFPPELIGKTYKNKSPNEDNQHKWTGKPYLSPYLTFKADSAMTPNPSSPTDGPTLKTHDYNQPNTWIYLNKQPENFQTGQNQKPWHQKFTYTQPGGASKGNFKRQGDTLVFQATGSGSQSLDTTINGDRTALMGIMRGLNVISRGQVYYHRPDDWKEQPNFFNPFWRARLAPVAQVLTNLFERLVGNNLVPGPEAGLIQQFLQNFINNALSDFFFKVVTQVICH